MVSKRVGRLSLTAPCRGGRRSRRGASRPRFVRATIASPSRMTSRWASARERRLDRRRRSRRLVARDRLDVARAARVELDGSRRARSSTGAATSVTDARPDAGTLESCLLTHDSRAPPGATASRRSPATAPCSTPGTPRPRSAPARRHRPAHRARPSSRTSPGADDAPRRARRLRHGRDRPGRRRRPPRPTPTCASTCSATCSCAPNTINLDGIFAPPADRGLDERRPGASGRLRTAAARAAARGHLGATASTSSRGCSTTSRPTRVRIADASRVRLGAHLAPGTTVMHEGFVNFNAGTLGTSMVEGRISQGVVVGDGSRHRRRRIHHGHALRRRHRAGRRSASARCSARTRASASRSATTRSSRPGST